MKEIEIRNATLKDIEGMLACLAAAFEPYRAHYTPEAFADTIVGTGGISRQMNQMSSLVAVEQGSVGASSNPIRELVVGTISYDVHRHAYAKSTNNPGQGLIFWDCVAYVGHIRGMAVLPSHLGSGVAARLLAAAEHSLKERDAKQVTLDTTEPLKRAQRFYEKNGYQPTGRESDFYGMRLIELGKSL